MSHRNEIDQKISVAHHDESEHQVKLDPDAYVDTYIPGTKEGAYFFPHGHTLFPHRPAWILR
jgi:hypothetical protein